MWRQAGVSTNSVAGEAVLDFMFWYLEPDFEYGFGRTHERSAGLSGGLLISIRWTLYGFTQISLWSPSSFCMPYLNCSM